jgi:hypothetical protein
VKTLILAGNYQQFRYYINKRNLNPFDYVYLHDPYQLQGLRKPKVIITGTVWRLPPKLQAEFRLLLREREAEVTEDIDY